MHHQTWTSPTGEEKNEVEERPGQALTTSGDEMTPGELTGKWENGQQQTQFLYLSTSESEESLSSDLEAEEEQEREGWEEERVNHTKERQKGYW